MPGSSTTLGHMDTRVVVPIRVAFRQENGVGARERTFAAPWLACAYPCRRFACTLAGTCARLGADAARYTFIVADFHRLLLAGLTGALSCSIMSRQSVPQHVTGSVRLIATSRHGLTVRVIIMMPPAPRHPSRKPGKRGTYRGSTPRNTCGGCRRKRGATKATV